MQSSPRKPESVNSARLTRHNLIQLIRVLTTLILLGGTSLVSVPGMVETPRLQAKNNWAKSPYGDEPGLIEVQNHDGLLVFSRLQADPR